VHAGQIAQDEGLEICVFIDMWSGFTDEYGQFEMFPFFSESDRNASIFDTSHYLGLLHYSFTLLILFLLFLE
jgi:hypothetical protein